jgi:hypothetical protein
MNSYEQNRQHRSRSGRILFDTWSIGSEPSPDPLDVDLDDGVGNRKEAARNRDFKALEKQLCEKRAENTAEPSVLLRLRQMGDRGLRAAMQKLKGE